MKNNEPQIPSRASEGRRHVCPAGIRGFPLPKGNRDADERGLNIWDFYSEYTAKSAKNAKGELKNGDPMIARCHFEKLYLLGYELLSLRLALLYINLV